MGDLRADIKIEFDFMGETKKADMSINYIGESCECYGVDDRVIEFFRNAYESGMHNYRAMIAEAEKESRRAETEVKERAELRRLKDKYERR